MSLSEGWDEVSHGDTEVGEERVLTSPMWKNKLCRFANCSGVIRRRPVLVSGTPPVADLYALKASWCNRA